MGILFCMYLFSDIYHLFFQHFGTEFLRPYTFYTESLFPDYERNFVFSLVRDTHNTNKKVKCFISEIYPALGQKKQNISFMSKKSPFSLFFLYISCVIHCIPILLIVLCSHKKNL